MALGTLANFQRLQSSFHFIDGPLAVAAPPEQSLPEPARAPPAALLPGAVPLPGPDAAPLRGGAHRGAPDPVQRHGRPDDWSVVRLLLHAGLRGSLQADAAHPAAGLLLLGDAAAQAGRRGADAAGERVPAPHAAALSLLSAQAEDVLADDPAGAAEIPHLPDVLHGPAGAQGHQLHADADGTHRGARGPGYLGDGRDLAPGQHRSPPAAQVLPAGERGNGGRGREAATGDPARGLRSNSQVGASPGGPAAPTPILCEAHPGGDQLPGPPAGADPPLQPEHHLHTVQRSLVASHPDLGARQQCAIAPRLAGRTGGHDQSSAGHIVDACGAATAVRRDTGHPWLAGAQELEVEMALPRPRLQDTDPPAGTEDSGTCHTRPTPPVPHCLRLLQCPASALHVEEIGSGRREGNPH